MKELLTALLPEIVLAATACILFLLGAKATRGVRLLAPFLATAGLLLATAIVICPALTKPFSDGYGTLRLSEFTFYFKILAGLVGVLLLLLQWPTDSDATGNRSLQYGKEAPEYFGLLLLSICGIFLVAGANDIILLFLGIELAALPTYVMVSISRPLPVAQEAGIKYFFLGALSAALMLFGFSYLFGTTGTLSLHEIAQQLRPALSSATVTLSSWQMLAAVLIIVGIAFKLAAFPLHFYAGDVYTGAATPLTALLSFVPKAAGLAALIRIVYVLGGESWVMPGNLVRLLWVIAVLTMTIGNVLGLMQSNIKRVMACSSIAHSGYMLAGVALLASAGSGYALALQGVLFYIAAYGLMNAGLFGVLMMLPAKPDPFADSPGERPATTAETYADIAGQGKLHPGLGLAMAACCFSLIGLPLTVGFFGKYYLIRPLLAAEWYGLAIIMVLNAAISAGYYLRIIGAMFLRSPETHEAPTACAATAGSDSCGRTCMKTVPVMVAVIVSAAGSILLGTLMPTTAALSTSAQQATDLATPAPTPKSATTLQP
jgi:NADH-quinone oxidoreductase subunit N